MSESNKTLMFVGVAAALVAMAASSHFMNLPRDSAGFELVGQPFFESFESSEQAASLEVTAVDAETGDSKRFAVENQDGLWRIPSHYNYPAEAASRLATTASSVIGISRDSLAGRGVKEHERLGVVDPLGEDIENPESVGKRITLKDSDGEVLVDYIIGKEASAEDIVANDNEDPFGSANGEEKYFYVRRPDEPQTYKVKLDIDLSTKFTDWIDPDLLRLERSNLTSIDVDNYELEEKQTGNILMPQRSVVKNQGDKIALNRANSTDAWKLDGLNEQIEELNIGKVNEIVNVVDQLEIAGVRPKFKYKGHVLINSDLTINVPEELRNDGQQTLQKALMNLQVELEQKGFNLAADESGKPEIVSTFGEFELGTEQGVVYTLHVGKPLDGDEEEIEIGLTENSEEQAEAAPNENGTGEATNEGEATEGTESDQDIRNRFMMVRVQFDESLLPNKPVEPTAPVEPEKPEGYEPAAEPEGEDPEAEDKSETPEGEDVPAPPKDDRNPAFVAYDEALKIYEQAKVEFEVASSKFKDDIEAFKKRVEEGEKIVAELNERFGDWYYVIAADNLKTLRTSRETLVQLKENPAAQPPEALPNRPNISFPPIPGMEPGGSDAGAVNEVEEEGSEDSENEKAEPSESVDSKNKTDGETKSEAGGPEEKPMKEDSPSSTKPATEAKESPEKEGEPDTGNSESNSGEGKAATEGGEPKKEASESNANKAETKDKKETEGKGL